MYIPVYTMKIIKKAVEIGNGAAVYVPREYNGREVVVILPENTEDIKRRILTSLIDYMPNILGVYVYGSYARGEQTEDSDIDILIITKNKDESIKKIMKDIDAIVLSYDELNRAIKNMPVFIAPILKEAKVLLNPLLLEELQKIKIDFKKFKWNFDDIKRIVKIIKTFIEIDEEDISASHIYSLIIRIRACYIIECLLKGKDFSNKDVKDLLLKYKLKKEDIDKFFEIYRKIRNDEPAKISIKKEEILPLINILEEYSKKLENETKEKIRKGD